MRFAGRPGEVHHADWRELPLIECLPRYAVSLTLPGSLLYHNIARSGSKSDRLWCWIKDCGFAVLAAETLAVIIRLSPS